MDLNTRIGCIVTSWEKIHKKNFQVNLNFDLIQPILIYQQEIFSGLPRRLLEYFQSTNVQYENWSKLYK